MTKRNKTVLIALLLLILAGVAAFLFGYNQEGFTGSRVKNPGEYLLDIEKMNGTDLHTLELSQGMCFKSNLKQRKATCTWRSKRRTGQPFTVGTGKKPRILR